MRDRQLFSSGMALGAEESTQNNGAAHALAERYSCSMPRCVSSSDMDELNGVRMISSSDMDELNGVRMISSSDMDELNGVRMTAHATWHA